MVARSTTGKAAAPGPKNSTNLPTTFALRSICVTVSARSVAVTPSRKRAGEMHAHDIRREEIDRLAEHAGFGFDAADAPAHDAEAVDHRRVRIGADEGVGIVNLRFAICDLRFGGQHAFGEVFEVHLVHDADAGRHDLEGVERLHAPLEKLVALAVALEFHLQIPPQRVGRAGKIHLHRVIHHQVHRHERFDEFRDSCPSRATAERIAARSTSSGTPVKSCNTMRATTNGISSVRSAFGFQLASARTAASVTLLPSQLRSTDSSTSRMETGSLETGPSPALSSCGSE